jgi:hypothetical protein
MDDKTLQPGGVTGEGMGFVKNTCDENSGH